MRLNLTGLSRLFDSWLTAANSIASVRTQRWPATPLAVLLSLNVMPVAADSPGTASGPQPANSQSATAGVQPAGAAAAQAALPVLRQALETARAAQAAGLPIVEVARTEAQRLQMELAAAQKERRAAQTVQGQHDDALKRLRETLDKAKKEGQKLQEAADAAHKTATEKADTPEADAAKEAATKADGKLQMGQKALTEAQAKVDEAEAAKAKDRPALDAAMGKVTAAEQAVQQFAPQLRAAEEAFAALARAALDSERALEAAEVDAGLRVSFARQIAPVFAAQCVACHNSRIAKGRFNLETYAQLMRGGESGPSIVPLKGTDSNLHVEIETGSMPKDADPLSAEQIALVRRWIDQGAKLDAGVSPTAPLISIAPKPTQPLPPETYRVPVPITALALTPDGAQLVAAGYREVLVWTVADGQLIRRIPNLAERPHAITITPDGARVIVAAGTPAQLGEVKVFRLSDGALLADLVTIDDEMFCAALSPDGQRIAVGGADRTVRVFHLETTTLERTFEEHSDWVLGIAWSPDGKRLLSTSRDKTAKICDLTTGESLQTFNGHGQPLFAAGFTPDGQHAVTAGKDNRLRVWNPKDGKQVREITGFGGEVYQIQILANGQVVSVAGDKQARLHQLADGKAIRAFAGAAEALYAVAADLAHQRLVTGSHDGEVAVWNLEDGKLLHKFKGVPKAMVTAETP